MNKKIYFICIGCLVVINIIMAVMIIVDYRSESHQDSINRIITINGTVYNQTLKNYYEIDYNSNGGETTFTIKNPCIKIVPSKGDSMQPYLSNDNLALIDECFPKDRLQIGDIIVYRGEWDSDLRIHHRIIDIDHKKLWVRTQGDNNLHKDDFVSFNRIVGKNIGYLNVLKDKRLVNEEVINKSDGGLRVLNVTNIVKECIATGQFLGGGSMCKCSKPIYNFSICNVFYSYKYCTDDWETIMEDDYFIKEINPYLVNDCNGVSLEPGVKNG